MTFGDMLFFGDDVPNLTVVNFTLLCVITVKSLLMIYLFIHYHPRIRHHLAVIEAQQLETASQQKETAAQQQEVWAVLQIIKDYAESARTNRVEAAEAVRESKEDHPTRADIANAVAKVPEETAARVIEKITKSSDSGERKAPEYPCP